MKQKIRNEREYWMACDEAEKMLQLRRHFDLTNAQKNRLAELSCAIEQYEFGGSCRLNYAEAR